MERLPTLIITASFGFVLFVAFGPVGQAGCGGQAKSVADGGIAVQDYDAAARDLTQVVGDRWECRIDRKWKGKDQVGLPTDELPESSYESVSNGVRYSVDFASDGSWVSVGEPAVKGQLAGDDPAKRRYELREGTFAGGRFVVWIAGANLGCELTLYGSGLPIVQSERGILEKR